MGACTSVAKTMRGDACVAAVPPEQPMEETTSAVEVAEEKYPDMEVSTAGGEGGPSVVSVTGEREKGRIENTTHRLKPVMVMVVVQTSFAGSNILVKLVADFGMSLRVLIAYRFLLAAVFMVPLALLIERKRRPKLTWVVVCQAFLCGLFVGPMANILFAEGLVLTSVTIASTMNNLVPAITFILTLSLGMERLAFGTWAGKAKVVGTLMCMGGAMVLTLYKGPEINIWSTNVNLLREEQIQGGHLTASHQKYNNSLVGALLVVCCCFSNALGLIIQAKLMRNYPCPYSSNALMITFGAIQAIGFGASTERDWSRWKLGWDIRLLTVAYTGIVGSGVMFTLIAWCIQVRGPLFVSLFNPLILVLVAIAGSLLLGEKLHLGTVLGAVVIVCGLYIVLWGKNKELKRNTQPMPSNSSWEPKESIDIMVSFSIKNSNVVNSSKCNTLPMVINNCKTNILPVIQDDVSLTYFNPVFQH